MRSVNLDDPRLADGCDCAKFTEDLGRDFLVHVDDADGFVGILHTAEGEVGDVDSVFSEQRADATDYAGNVLVAEEQKESGERRVNVNVVYAKDPQRIIQPDHAEDRNRFSVDA